MENNKKIETESFSIFSIIENLEKKDKLQQEIAKLNRERIEIEKNIKEVLSHISSYFIRDYIAEKLVENFYGEIKEKYKKYHQENLTYLKSYIKKFDNIKVGILSTLKEEEHSSQSYSVSNVFDPYFDSWDLVDVEWTNDKTYVRFSVTCHKLEGHLSPFDRILSLFWTVWIPIDELKNEDSRNSRIFVKK